MSNSVLVTTLITDVLSWIGMPGASLVEGIKKVMKSRLELARETLIEELRQGTAFVGQAASIDEWVAILLRYYRAAQEGTARLNLRLMAKVISGQAQAKSLIADEFLAWADVLASLRREEVVFVAALHAAKAESANSEDLKSLWLLVSHRLIPGFFADEDQMRSVGYSAMRTGLVIIPPDFFGLGYFTTSPQMAQLENLASFQDALREEGIDLEKNHGCP